MTYKTKSCPHCGKTYAWMETGRHFGSPFRNCASCKNSFIDKDYIELACMPRGYGRQRKVTSFSITSPILGLIFIALGVYQTARGDSGGMDILFIAFGALFVFGGGYFIAKDISTHSERCKQLDRELRDSRKRLSDPFYAQSLVKIGVSVPPEFLQKKQSPHSCEPHYWMESANGMTVRVPESKLDTWQKAQEGQEQQLTEEQKRMIKDKIIREIYGPKPENK